MLLHHQMVIQIEVGLVQIRKQFLGLIQQMVYLNVKKIRMLQLYLVMVLVVLVKRRIAVKNKRSIV
jgi:hypothetical protein